MVLDPIPQSLPVHFFGSRPQPPTSLSLTEKTHVLCRKDSCTLQNRLMYSADTLASGHRSQTNIFDSCILQIPTHTLYSHKYIYIYIHVRKKLQMLIQIYICIHGIHVYLDLYKSSPLLWHRSQVEGLAHVFCRYLHIHCIHTHMYIYMYMYVINYRC